MSAKELWSKILPPKPGDKVKIISASLYEEGKFTKFIIGKTGVVVEVIADEYFVKIQRGKTKIIVHLKRSDILYE